nr:hypothetical protein [Mucilaginibacter sp. L294]
MKKILLFLFTAFSLPALAQNKVVENPRIDRLKQQITIYTDSGFLNKKVISTDLQKFKLLTWNGKGWKAERSGLSAQPVDTVFIKDGQFVRTPEYRAAIESYEPKFKQMHEAYYKGLIKAYGKKIGSGIFFGVPVVGMTTRQFYMCMDSPDDKNTTQTAYGTSEQFVYRYGEFGTKYYYFTNGKLTAIQD